MSLGAQDRAQELQGLRMDPFVGAFARPGHVERFDLLLRQPRPERSDPQPEGSSWIPGRLVQTFGDGVPENMSFGSVDRSSEMAAWWNGIESTADSSVSLPLL